MTERDNLMVAYRNTKHMSHETAKRLLRGPELPEHLDYVWQWFLDVRRGLDDSMAGPPKITWTQLDAWSRLRMITLDEEEEAMLLAADVAYRHPETLGDRAWT